MNLIIYHARCPDGWCSAFIAKKRYPEAELLGLDHGSPVPFDSVHGKDVLVVDFSWPNREDNVELHRIAKSFHVYDHHKTALECLEGLDFVTFDMKRSGAGLTWDYLFGFDSKFANGHINGPDAMFKVLGRPWYVNFVEDRDLWNWALLDSKAVNSYLMTLPMTLDAWKHLDDITAEEAAKLGRSALAHVEHYVREAVQQAQRGFLKTGENSFLTVEIVNALYLNCSEIGNVLAQRANVGMSYYEGSDGATHFSLRSIGDRDVSAIAKEYGGGGHRNASGFKLDIRSGRELIDKILGRAAWRLTTL